MAGGDGWQCLAGYMKKAELDFTEASNMCSGAGGSSGGRQFHPGGVAPTRTCTAAGTASS